ncbi:PAS domain-containing protein [Granulibacter bethesdensis]|uniref:Sensory transduction protein kinase n=2 Tax=Granulibacter bethesdensis TaxID=364410 RepID=Q0BT22_GRABC|nr:PAS domain-containing protein [Granulibacter bethesdensis]ABI62030.1 Sensory transduction protein kinase [Granulibacter bethesdensis CGDNIH1]AHJ62959.1 Sensory transduction protein kinase [Granulibacter bethesdensis]AHJ66468.1 Sensory transduction protein kinase [Granulibacter bethesdensis CGDNIH4]AHJ69074.1 Sensory transduction protein kinase [Granulibacter bethesdensis]APH51851.1 Sensory transduction protein kinase [Granulibacter bethesdensis]
MKQSAPAYLIDYFRHSRVALALAAPDGNHDLLWVNGPFSALTGYSSAEVIGKNCRFLQGDADNEAGKAKIRQFLQNHDQASVRTPVINFRKDKVPFVNLLSLSRLQGADGTTKYIFASQFDVSRSHPDLLINYDRELAATLGGLRSIEKDGGIVVQGTVLTIANTSALVAQAKMTLAELENVPDA